VNEGWHFFIDVGGTFTDVVARRPDGLLTTYKMLSSGGIRGQCAQGSTADCIIDPSRIGPDGFWVGYRASFVADSYRDREEADLATARVTAFDSRTGALQLDRCLVNIGPTNRRGLKPAAQGYELRCDHESPVVAIRLLMGLRLDQPIGPVNVRLGTTRATNALLERKGAKVAFVTTRGFGDLLKIGYQDRPALFELDIRKREDLACCVVEIEERMDARGRVLVAPDERDVRQRLESARDAGAEAAAICLLHSHTNPAHEEFVALTAESVGFPRISVSSRLMRLERIVPRADTTVVDAYLSGVIRSYIASLRRAMPEAAISLMTSSGGLVDAARAAGYQTVLSGPAGGAVGCAHLTYAAGFDQAIGFDMGGTSTDVCKIEPPPDSFEYQHETVKAGVRLMAPMIAVETVAAGGGSTCAFDGQKLTVGPHSAGADPGPACYGRGGPLTITDCNLVLGRVAADFFPFPLDRQAVHQRLKPLCDRTKLSPVELADGFVRIANANMAAAIKRISLAKGYDPARYVLTTFGGAGGQHACAIARTLGIRRILYSPFAGVLSALGLSVADVKRIGQRSVDVPLDKAASDKLEPLYADMETDLRHELLDDGIEPALFAEPLRTLDVCYVGQSSTVTVSAGSLEHVRREFESLHRQLYGYLHEGRDVHVRVVRAEVRCRHGRNVTEPRPARVPTYVDIAYAACSDHEMVIDGQPQRVPLCTRRDLTPGLTIAGPAMLVEDTSTIVIDPGWTASVNESGDVIVEDQALYLPARGAAVRVGRAAPPEPDPIRLELFHNQFAAIAEQMGVTLRRTALSVNVKERLDFSCAVFTPRGELVANAPHIPVHLGGMSDCVKCLMEDVGGFENGDVYITNDPYRGGSHLNDVTVVTPVHDPSGERLLFFVASRAHHAEIGGKRPGSMPPDSTCLAEEGVLIRAFRYVKAGTARAEELRQLLASSPYPTRAAEENIADITAQVAANQTGARELLAMIDRENLEAVHAYMGHIQSAAEQKMRAALSRIRNGVYRFEDRLDDGATIRLAITVHDGEATLDFTGTDPVHAGNLNANRAIVTSATLYCFRCLIDEDIPLNGGVLAALQIVLPTCFVNPPSAADPRDCPAIVGGNVETSQRIVDCIFGALGTVAASQGTMNNLLMGNQRFGYYETICGGAGAGPSFDGADAVHTHMTNTRLTDPEVLESRYPVRLVRFAIRQGTGGKGRFRGGNGVIREMEFLEPLEVSILSQRRTTAPYGVRGGEPGRSGRNVLRRAGSNADQLLGPIASLTVNAGDRLTIETPGGGGFGQCTANRRVRDQ
jgi:5-oxoprolinase (ATP-hydrolysing)